MPIVSVYIGLIGHLHSFTRRQGNIIPVLQMGKLRHGGTKGQVLFYLLSAEVDLVAEGPSSSTLLESLKIH